MALSKEEAALAKQASFGDDIASQREAAVALADMQEYEDSPEAEVIQAPKKEELPSWDQVMGTEEVPSPQQETLPTWEELQEFQKALDKDVLKNLPENLYLLGMEIPLHKKTSAFLVSTGDAMTWAYHGVKQMLGIDERDMEDNQKYMNKLYQSSVGGWAAAGQVYGSVFEPLGFLAPGGKAAKVSHALAKGAGVGATYGALGYVDKSQGQTRLGNTILGGTLGGAFNGAFQGLAIRGDKKAVARAAKDMDEFELQYARALLEGNSERAASRVALARMPKSFSLIDTSAKIGRRFNPPRTVEEASELVLYHKGTAKKSDFAMGLDSWAGIVSTRIGNISKAILKRLRDHDKAVTTNQHHYFTRVDQFLDNYKSSFKGQEKKTMDKALMDGDFLVAEKMMYQKGGQQLVDQWREVQKVLDELGDQAMDLGLITGKLKNYFPRYITDYDKMLSRVGAKNRSLIEKAIRQAEEKLANKKGRSLTNIEKSDIVNKVLRGYGPKEGKSPFTKQRSYNRIPSILMDYYASPEEALHSYIRNMVNDVEKHKFFGRNLKKIQAGGAQIFDVDESVGALIREQEKINPMSTSEFKELSGLLQTRFGIGEQSPAGLTQNIKNMLYIGLIANPIAAATQLGDLGVSIYINGFRDTLKALPKALKSSWGDVTVKDWGLTDQLAEEFATTKQSARWLHRAFKYSGFKYVDRLGKDTMINAAFNRFKRLAKTNKGIDKFRKQYGEYLGDEFEDVVKDLKAGKATERVQSLLFSELADVQPISLSEVPERYLKMPNGRIMYMLKTFMLKQVDVLRKTAYQEIKKGNVAKGLMNASEYALIMGATGTGSQVIKDIMLYGPTDEDIPFPKFEDLPAEFGANAVKTFGWSEYILETMKREGPYAAAMNAFKPPFEIFDDFWKGVTEGDTEALKYAPIAGKLYHYWIDGGAKDAAEKRRKEEMKELLDTGVDVDDVLDGYNQYLEE